MSEPADRYLVLCVDRDDDLGVKAKVPTPVVGREAVLSAATKLALADPEEADANAMFAAVSKYDELTKAGTSCEVALVCGEENRGFEADRRVGKEVANVLGSSAFTGVVLVSDGGEDEQVIPIIQSMKPIVSVQRVAVKHSQTVEETYQVLGRYLRMLVYDPRYSRWALGVPGLILILAGLLIVAGQVVVAELAILLILGGAFLVRGFNVDRTVAGLLQRGGTGYIRLFTMVVSVLVVIAGLFSGYGAMQTGVPGDLVAVSNNPANLLVYGAALMGYMIGGSILLVFGGIAIYSTGGLLTHVLRDSPRWKRDGFVLVLLAILYLPVWTFSNFLKSGSAEYTYLLISYILAGLATIFILTSAIYPRVRTRVTTTSESE
jgi:putative membrane protein